MGFSVIVASTGVIVRLRGWDRIFLCRRSVSIPNENVDSARVTIRGELEPKIHARVLGRGTHAGARRPGRRRIGNMIGEGVLGRQFWAVRSGGPERRLLVLDLHDHRYARAVLEVDDPAAAAFRLSR